MVCAIKDRNLLKADSSADLRAKILRVFCLQNRFISCKLKHHRNKPILSNTKSYEEDKSLDPPPNREKGHLAENPLRNGDHRIPPRSCAGRVPTNSQPLPPTALSSRRVVISPMENDNLGGTVLNTKCDAPHGIPWGVFDFYKDPRINHA